jgi:hypothetical protein
METKINVSLRVKPLTKAEEANDKNHLWAIKADGAIMNQRTKEVFSFDRVFGPDVSTETIFET